MSSAPLQLDCILCPRPAAQRCAHCDRPVCVRHRGKGEPPEPCAACDEAVQVRMRSYLPARIAVDAGAAVVGMMIGAAAVLAAAAALGLAPEIVVLIMLVAEVGCGALSAIATDRKMHSYLLRRAERSCAELPAARVLSE